MSDVSLVPRLSRGEERVWEPLHAHAPILPGKHGKPEITVKQSYSGPESREETNRDGNAKKYW